jgi:glucose-6-phosphate isomerase
MPALSSSPAWQALQAHSEDLRSSGFRIAEQFRDSNRFRDFSLRQGELLLDYSKNYCSQDTLTLLLDLAEQQGVSAAIAAMFAGEHINTSEDRAALHTALRLPAAANPRPEVLACLNKMNDFVSAIHSGSWTGFDGQAITDVVNIGIGGSDLGPAMVTEALADFASGKLRLHFVSNIDPNHVQSTLRQLNPATTLFIIASKSFRTQETHANAQQARCWFLAHCNDESQIAKHFVAISTNLQAAQAFGIDPENLFPLWDWVGGRYSLWSAIGLSIALAIGMKNFQSLLAGANAMDEHFRQAALQENMPVVLALLAVWYGGFLGARSNAVVPYAHRLREFPLFLQQLSMESLGKSVTSAGEPLDVASGDVIWGAEGSNGQHSFFQLLHQGSDLIPVDFIALARGNAKVDPLQHQQLLANCLSQSIALMQGRANSEQAHRHYAGNKPSNTLLLAELNPYNLGSLIALYEHKVYVQSVLWGINAFDQWGVELGKELSDSVMQAFVDSEAKQALDESSRGLIDQIAEWS